MKGIQLSVKIYKNKWFRKWAIKEGLNDDSLVAAIKEMNNGIVDAYLGANLVKKRIAIGDRGKSGGVRTLIAFKLDDKAFFMYGFAKTRKKTLILPNSKR